MKWKIKWAARRTFDAGMQAGYGFEPSRGNSPAEKYLWNTAYMRGSGLYMLDLPGVWDRMVTVPEFKAEQLTRLLGNICFALRLYHELPAGEEARQHVKAHIALWTDKVRDVPDGFTPDQIQRIKVNLRWLEVDPIVDFKLSPAGTPSGAHPT